MKNYCRKCGLVHDEWPSLEFCHPFYYSRLSRSEQEGQAELIHDFCTIRNPSQTDHYIRAMITQKVNDHCDTLQYAVWILLNEDCFEDYSKNYFSNDHEAVYFGFLSNQIPGYNNTLSVRVTIYAHKGMERPEAVPHKDQTRNKFVSDFYNGISADDVQRKIKYILGE